MWCLHGLNDPMMSIFIMIIITRGSAAWLVVAYPYFLRVWWTGSIDWLLIAEMHRIACQSYRPPAYRRQSYAGLFGRSLCLMMAPRHYLLFGIIHAKIPDWWVWTLCFDFHMMTRPILYILLTAAGRYWLRCLCTGLLRWDFVLFALFALSFRRRVSPNCTIRLKHRRRGIFIICPHDLCYLHRCSTDYQLMQGRMIDMPCICQTFENVWQNYLVTCASYDPIAVIIHCFVLLSWLISAMMEAILPLWTVARGPFAWIDPWSYFVDIVSTLDWHLMPTHSPFRPTL